MNLNGKYIEINRNNCKIGITFLYSNGYYWLDNSYNLEYAIRNISEELNNENPKLYLVINSNRFYYNKYKPVFICGFLDINKLLREEKLKRILK